jgi:Zn-dependent M28 family amino/carboxypeptidase
MASGGRIQLDQPGLPAAFGAMSWEGAGALARGAGSDLERLVNDQPGSSFRSVTLPVRADLEVNAAVRRFTSNNVIGRIPGSGGGGESIVLLGHWDHLGICRPPSEADRICNGAVDNASGIAALIEAGGRLAAGPKPKRDILILATTAEESGLLGAETFARTPPVPRASIVAGINVDTLAVAPAGTPVAVIGGNPQMDLVIGRVALGLGRKLDTDREADIMATRQDGWALTSNGIPTFMAVGNASDMNLLRQFLSGTYHGPQDQPAATIEYGGAVEDSNLLVALARAFADPAQYSPAPGQPAVREQP